MVDNPIEPTERHRDEGVYVSRIENEKKDREKFSSFIPNTSKKVLIATFFSYLRKLFDTFSPTKKLAGKIIVQHSIIEHLNHFKNLLSKLEKENLSNSLEYASLLSEAWIQIQSDFEDLRILERKNLKGLSSFRYFVDQIRNYPPEAEHRLGYYLIEHAGKDWIPFHFLEILENLHEKSKKTPENHPIKNWKDAIDLLIQQFQQRLPFKLS